MSSSLYWRPVPAGPEGERLGAGNQLKYAISRSLFDHDGSFSSEWVTVDEEFVPFLRGVSAAARDRSPDLHLEAEQLIALIERHGAVQLRTSQ
jgi:hypothetical protein